MSQQPQQQHGQPTTPQAQQQSQGQLEHALQQHAQVHGLNLSGIDWAAITAAVLQIIQAVARASGGQPTP